MNRAKNHTRHINIEEMFPVVWLTTLMCLAPSLVFAVDAADTQLLPMGLKVLAALVVVLGFVLLIYAGLKRSGRWIRVGTDSAIQLIEVRYLAPKKTLYLIEVNGSKLLLSGTSDRLEAVAQWQIDDAKSVSDEDVSSTSHFDAELRQQVNVKQGLDL